MKVNTLPITTLVIALLLSIIANSQIVDTASAQTDANNEQSSLVDGWHKDPQGGYYSESNATIRIWSDAHDQGFAFYKEITPVTDFEFSLQVKAARIDGFGICIGNEAFLNGSKTGVQFEFHNKYGINTFLLARYVHTLVWETREYGDIWDWQGFAYGEENVWYTMKLTVQTEPFKVSGEVFNENGVSIGSYSVSDMINFTFKDIEFICFGNGWGGDYYIRNISDISTITENPDPNQTPGKIETQISISTDIPSTLLGTPVNVKGKLADLNGTGLTNKTIVLSYTFTGLDSWIPISSSTTNAMGDYSIQWDNTATGDFTLKAAWSGNEIHKGSSNTAILSILPFENQTAFIVESNSTVTAFAFNSTDNKLEFSVTGPSGTTGYAQVIIAKDLMTNIEGLKVFLDGEDLEHKITSKDDLWLVSFNYSHSTHKVSLQMNQVSITQPEPTLAVITAAAIIVAIIGIAIIYGLKKE